MRPNFINSTGWSEKGRNGILIHPLAPLYVVPMKNTIIKEIIPAIKICFAYFSKKEYGVFTTKVKSINHNIT